MGDDHVNPLMRPTVQKLYNKLWSMKILHDQDNRVHILQRLAVELDPPHLAELIWQLQGRLYYKLGYISTAEEKGWPVLHFGDAKWPWQWGEEPKLPLAEPLVSDGGAHVEVIGTDLTGSVDLEAGIKNGLLNIIKEHTPIFGAQKVVCYCDKEYHGRVEWANHLRVKIWSYLENESIVGLERSVPEMRTTEVNQS